MKYKILLATDNMNTIYYKYYQESPADGDWSTTDKQVAIDTINTLLQTYPLSEISVVINLDITTNIDIPELPTASGTEEETSSVSEDDDATQN